MSTTTTATNTAKRKAKSTPSTAKRPAKKPRQTLDSFFAPQVAVCNEDPGSQATTKQVSLSAEQIKVLRMVVNDEQNVFFTGAAGTGKSLLLRAIINALRAKYAKDPDAVAVTASTGMAASNIGGQTLHAWGAVAPTVDDLDNLIKCIRTCRPALQRWKKAKVLIIDEISMVDGFFFNRLCEIAKRLRRKTTKPFGGLQLVVTGDFFQLPPVTKNGHEPIFAFESAAWKETLHHTINLVQVFRQTDQAFVDALNSLRHGEPSHEAIELFRSLSRPLEPVALPPPPASQQPYPTPPSSLTSTPAPFLSKRQNNAIFPTELFPHRYAVANSNRERLDAIKAQPFTYNATDTGSKPSLLESLLAEQTVELKLGAQVMLIKNVDEVLVNGLVGKVIGFYRSWELISFPPNPPERKPLSNVFTNASRRRSLPPGPAPTPDIKKNGTLVRHVFLNADGRSPVRPTIDGNEDSAKKENVDTKNDDPVKKENVSAAEKGKNSATGRNNERFPLVLFEYGNAGVMGETQTEAVLITRDEFRVEDAEGKVLARRVQIPLILAWAMSIHKSQGQTIHRVKVDLSKVFERGQSYVALSRASSVDGLQVLGFDPKKVMAHQKVVEWSKTLEVADVSGDDDEP